MSQQSLGLETRDIDLAKFVKFEPSTSPMRYTVSGAGGRRSGQTGLCLGVISLKHASGYEVLLEFPDGKVDSFAPLDLFPVQEPAPRELDDGPSGP